MLAVTLTDAVTRPHGAPPRQTEQRCEPGEALRRCRAAAAAEIGWRDGGDYARQDAASHVLMLRMEEALSESDGATCWPRHERVRMGILRLDVRDWFRRERRHREREGLSAELPSLDQVELYGRPGEDPAPLALPHEPAMRAAEMLATRLRLPYLPVHAALYVLLRGVQTDEAADAWGVTHDSFRQSISRGKRAIRDAYPDPAELLRALSLLDQGGQDARHRTRMLAPDWRTEPAAHGDVTVRHCAPTPRVRPADIAEHVYNLRRAEHRDARTRRSRRHAGTGALSHR